MINISVSDSQERCDVANVEQVLSNLLQDETVEVSERSRSNYCKIRKCWDVTALVLVTRLIVCRRQTDRLAGLGTDSSFTRGQPLLPRKSDAKSDSNW